jgi:DNA-binding transcriptional regulator YiaG
MKTGTGTHARRRKRHCAAAWHRRFGARMRILRLALRLTEAQAAEAYGVTLGTYQRYEAGSPMRSGTSKLLRFIERHPAISLDWLLCGDHRNVPRDLSHNTPGRVAILPVSHKPRRRGPAVALPAEREGA